MGQSNGILVARTLMNIWECTIILNLGAHGKMLAGKAKEEATDIPP